MKQREINQLLELLQAYDERHGEGKADEILSGLMYLPISEQIKIFKTAGKREIVLEPSPDAIDGIEVKYK